MDLTMAPQLDPDREEMARADFKVPAPLMRDVEALAAVDGYSKSEFLRLCLFMGFSEYCERKNKVLVNVNLRQRKQNESSQDAE